MHTQSLLYNPNSADLFDHFSHLPLAIFLDSCAPNTSGRYDIIVADPISTFSPSKNIFTEIEAALSDLKKGVEKNIHDSPFTIGAVGYLSYDLSQLFENIPSAVICDIQLPTAAVGIYDWSIVVDHVKKKTTFFSLNDLKHPRIKKILSLLEKKPAHASFQITQPFLSNMTKSEYEKSFGIIQENILEGNCYQINFAQRFSSEFTGSPWMAYQMLREKNPSPFSAFLNLKNQAILSCSPERFIRVDKGLVETKPIKGTSARFQDKNKDDASAKQLQMSEKDRAENIMIVDLLRNDLSRTCLDVNTPVLCALESFPHVHHLVSTINARLPIGKSALSVLKNCFPGGSITGAPKIAAQKIIAELEPHHRSAYCGNIFYADIFGNMDSNILIRTAICDHNQIYCYAGGGIVRDSECNAEFEETLTKIKKMIAILENKVLR